MIKRVLLIMILFVFPVISLSFAEKTDIKKPPLGQILDYTDKVISWDAGFKKVETYSLLDDNFPILDNPHKLCKAREGWDSYPNGENLPIRNYYFAKGYPDQYAEPFCLREFSKEIMKRKTGDTSLFKHIPDSASYAVKRHFCPSGYWKDPKLRKTVDKLRNETYGGKFLPINEREWYYIRAESGRDYMEHKTVLAFKKLQIGASGILKEQVLKQYEGYELLDISVEWPVPSSSKTRIVLRDPATDELVIFDPKGRIWRRRPFKSTFGFGCWDPFRFQFYHNHPSLLFYDRNFGVPRGTPLPKWPHDGLLVPPPVESFRLKPKSYQSRVALYDLEQGGIEMDLGNIFFGRIVAPHRLLVPNVAKNGYLGYSLIEKGKQIAYIPYQAIFPQDHLEYRYYPGSHCQLFISRGCLVVLDNSSLEFRKYTLNSPVDIKGFSYLEGVTFVLVTEPWLKNGKAIRQIIVLSKGLWDYHVIRSFLVDATAFECQGEKTIIHNFDWLYVFFEGKAVKIRIHK